MKKTKRLVLWIASLFLLCVVAVTIIIRILSDSTRLTPMENEWLNSNLNKVLNVSVVNDTNLFGTKGVGVFYDFISDFSSEYSLKVNPITYNTTESANGLSFGISNTLRSNQIGFYEDHYVLVGKTKELIYSEEYLKGKKVGMLNNNLSHVQDFLNVSLSVTSYNSRDDLLKALDAGEIGAMVVPRIEYMDVILSKGYQINYHFSSIPRYYVLSLDEEKDTNFSSVLKKYYSKWEKKRFESSFYQQEFQLFTQSLGISKTDVDKLQSITYYYGFVNTSPYEVLTGGNFGGIVASYLNEFSRFSGIDLKFKRYSNYKKLVSAIGSGDVNLYFEYYNFTSEGKDILSNIILSYDVLIPSSNPAVVSSMKSLQGNTIYVEDNTLLSSKLKSLSGIHVETYSGKKGLKAIIKKNGIIVMDHARSVYYQDNLLKNYSVRYASNLDASYALRSTANETFQKLFASYLNYLDDNRMMNIGMYHHAYTIKNGTILGTIAKYFIFVIVGFFLLFFVLYRSSKKIRLKNKVKKEDKIKLIDQLTSLKNRNYLNENIAIWNKNTIYPQTVIVADLNRLQEINDTAGYEQGDEQIKAAANILIKTQLDNSDVIRTDGNEFLIYLVGYQQKQITSYIYKLNREFKHLPYDFGASIGYSMIESDLKSIEDAINEAVEDVKKQKETKKEDKSL